MVQPPFNRKTKTKIDKSLLKLLDKHFPPQTKSIYFLSGTMGKLAKANLPNMNT